MNGKKQTRRQLFKNFIYGGGTLAFFAKRRAAFAAPPVSTSRLASNPTELKAIVEIDALVIGSGYGGAVSAARLAQRGQSVVVLEQGLEWRPGDFPRTPLQALRTFFRPTRPKINPLGLFRFNRGKGVSVLSGAGLGGTSLINAGVALRPPAEIFKDANWPSDLGSTELDRYFTRAETMLGATPVPGDLTRYPKLAVHARAAGSEGLTLEKVPLAVDFRKCANCGDCMSGCNFGAKNTLDHNYLPLAKKHGARIFTQTRVRNFRKLADGRFEISYERIGNGNGETTFSGTVIARKLIVAAGSLGSTELLLRSQAERGIAFSPRLGDRFSANGDVIALSYNGLSQTEIVGIGQRWPRKNQIGDCGPSVITKIEIAVPGEAPYVVEDLSMPSLMGSLLRKPLALLYLARGGNPESAAGRALLDLMPERNSRGAIAHSVVAVGLGKDSSQGKITLDPGGFATVNWPGAGEKDPSFSRITARLETFFGADGVFKTFTAWLNGDGQFKKLMGDNVISGHPLGGCPMGDDVSRGVVDSKGRVFDPAGGVHPGLYVCDASIIPVALGVNPFLTIAALAEKISEEI